MNIMPGASIAADALEAQKTRMEVVSQNMAHAQTTRGIDGKPYKRSMVTFEAFIDKNLRDITPDDKLAESVRVGSIVKDQTPGMKMYNPGHPDADENGMVQMPNVEVSKEMVDMIMASRGYEANLTSIKTARQMAQQAITMGRI